jgi:hypothetical protein
MRQSLRFASAAMLFLIMAALELKLRFVLGWAPDLVLAFLVLAALILPTIVLLFFIAASWFVFAWHSGVPLELWLMLFLPLCAAVVRRYLAVRFRLLAVFLVPICILIFYATVSFSALRGEWLRLMADMFLSALAASFFADDGEKPYRHLQ